MTRVYALCAFTAGVAAMVMTLGGQLLLGLQLPPVVMVNLVWGWIGACFGVTWMLGWLNGRRARQ